MSFLDWKKAWSEYNETAIKMGVKRIIRKDYKRLSEFAGNLADEIRAMINGSV